MQRNAYKIYLSFIFTVGLGWLLMAWTWLPVRTIATTCTRFEVDELQNIYLLYDDHLELVRQQRGDVLRTSHLEYGPQYQLDASNPLKPFLYYPDQGLFLAMDNTLTVNGNAVRLPEMGYEQIEWVAGSQGDHYWLWDALQSEMLRVDQHFRLKNRSGNLAARLGRRIRPIRIEEDGDGVYLLLEGEIVELDLFGAYRRSIQWPLGKDVRMESGKVWFSAHNRLHQIDWATGEADSIQLDVAMAGPIRWSNGRVYGLDGQRLIVYEAGP